MKFEIEENLFNLINSQIDLTQSKTTLSKGDARFLNIK